MANIPIPENDDSLELNVRYQPDMVLEGMLDATVPEMKYLRLSQGNETHDLLGAQSGDQILELLSEDLTAADNGKVLTAAYGGLEGEETGSVVWGRVDRLPVIGSGDAGKVLTVNAGETGTEWAEAPSGLPEITNSDEGKVLTVVEGKEETTTTIVPEQTIVYDGTSVADVADIGTMADEEADGFDGDYSITVEKDGVKATYPVAVNVMENSAYFLHDNIGFRYRTNNNTLVFQASEAGTYKASIIKTEVVPSGAYNAEWVEPKVIGNQCTIGSILSTALTASVGSLVQQSIQASATKHQYVSLSAPLNDYLPDAMSIRQAVKKCVNDGVSATISLLGQSVVLQTCVIGESNSTPEYTICGTIPAYGMTVPTVGHYLFRVIVTLDFVIDDSDNISAGSYALTVEPVVTPSTT